MARAEVYNTFSALLWIYLSMLRCVIMLWPPLQPLLMAFNPSISKFAKEPNNIDSRTGTHSTGIRCDCVLFNDWVNHITKWWAKVWNSSFWSFLSNVDLVVPISIQRQPNNAWNSFLGCFAIQHCFFPLQFNSHITISIVLIPNIKCFRKLK